MIPRANPTILLAFCLFSSSCAFLRRPVPSEAPPLFDLEQPLALAAEPQDEEARAKLAPGCFSGIEVAQSKGSLEELADAAAGSGAPGLEVARVVENSPADVAGIEAGDLLVSAQTASSPAVKALAWPSEWRAIELESAPGTRLSLVVDRAAVRRTVELVLAPRARAAERQASARVREEKRVGIVLRTPTEVEARAAGLAPGAGAVVVGLARSSPWRKAGVRFEDLLVAVGGREVADPEVALAAIRAADDGAVLDLELVRAGRRETLRAPLTSRESELTEVSIPILYDYENDRGHTTTSVLLGLYRFERTEVAWRLRLLWLISFSGGESDRLEEVGS